MLPSLSLAAARLAIVAMALAVITVCAAALPPAKALQRTGVGPARCVAGPRAGCALGSQRGSRQPGTAGDKEAGGEGSGGLPSAGAAAKPGEAEGAFRFFSPTSFWNTPLPADAVLDPRSAEMTAALDTEVQREIRDGKGPAINTTAFSVPIYTVPADQPTVEVNLRQSSPAAALRSAWRSVPLPDNAEPAAGTDHHLVVWQPSTDRLWEFWHLQRRFDGWEAGWGGAMQDVSTSSGAYGPDSWPGATPWWGASASSLSIAGGLITLEDLQQGKIDHVLAIALPAIRAGLYASPAQRTDGKSSDPLSLPEGAHLRLDPSVDIGALNLPPLTRMIAEAAQRYGIVVRDGASSVALYAQDPTPTGKNPFSGPNGYFEGQRAPLKSFPWNRLQLLRMELTEVA